MPGDRYQSWGRYPAANSETQSIASRYAELELPADKSVLPFGNGRSYGDSCLNDGGVLLDTKNLGHFIAFDQETGVLIIVRSKQGICV